MNQTRRTELAAIEVLGTDGAAVPLRSLWGERAALLLLIRHFG